VTSDISQQAMDAYSIRQFERWQRYYEKRHLASIADRGAAFVKRDQQILQMRHAGSTLQQIAWEFGISRGRVWQICTRANRAATTPAGWAYNGRDAT